jgi:hypothetical protein
MTIALDIAYPFPSLGYCKMLMLTMQLSNMAELQHFICLAGFHQSIS